ncbi:MAG: type III-B CRISPR module RAMP protein Cmr4 [Leptolyngbyaceae cyanobacterium RM1_1_2]|nr:type III-B CRISPR module RAMP protein Cmr4 [Leptolyngbyaceae cyanobacterium RM1_1_2]
MYHKAYGIIETLAPLHVGASAGEETGNLNLIFRDQFTQTGIIPGSSIRGRFRADMRQQKKDFSHWYGAGAKTGEPNSTTEGIVKFEYASILWMPVYCPNQPVVRVSCPILLKRYHKLAVGETAMPTFKPYSYYGKESPEKLFFNLGFLKLGDKDKNLQHYIPDFVSDPNAYLLLVVDDKDMAMIHDMALYRQSRVALEDTQKRSKKGAFFDVEALPEGTIMTFPLASRTAVQEQDIQLQTFFEVAGFEKSRELYFGGLESVGFGRSQVTLKQSTHAIA